MTEDSMLDRLEASAVIERVGRSGRQVAWRRWGQGDPLVLLHGGHGSWRHWVRNIEALSSHYTVLLPDLPGFGDSDDVVALEPHAPDRLARLVEAVTDSMDELVGATTAIHLGGFSFGGLVAAHVTAARGRIKRLVLLGPGGHESPRRQRQPMRDWRVQNRDDMLDALRHNLETLMLHDKGAIDDLALQVHEISCKETRFRSRAVSMAGSLRLALSAFDGPVLAMWGRYDVTATPEIAGPLLCDGHVRRRWQMCDGAGHWLQYERPDVVNAALSRWQKLEGD